MINNVWAAQDELEQKIIVYEDGHGPNYLEVLLGVKPWGSHDFKNDVLPLQLDNIETLQMELDMEYEIYEEKYVWNGDRLKSVLTNLVGLP